MGVLRNFRNISRYNWIFTTLSQNEDDNTNHIHDNYSRQIYERNEIRAVATEYDDPYNEEEDGDYDHDHYYRDNQFIDHYDDSPRKGDLNFNQGPNFNHANSCKFSKSSFPADK